MLSSICYILYTIDRSPAVLRKTGGGKGGRRGAFGAAPAGAMADPAEASPASIFVDCYLCVLFIFFSFVELSLYFTFILICFIDLLALRRPRRRWLL